MRHTRASNGQLLPCPAHLEFAISSFFVLLEESRAAASIGDKVLYFGDFLFVHWSIHSSFVIYSQTWQAGLRTGWLALRPGWLGLRTGWLGLRSGLLAEPETWLARP